MSVRSNSHIPLWLKLAWTAWIIVWAPLYARQYGAQNFLYYCDIGNLLIAIGLWIESRFILSWQAVSLLVFQTLYAVDLLGALLLRIHPFGGTEYIFDLRIPLMVRLLGLYHFIVPPLLLWAVYRLGYDSRAWSFATLECWMLVPISFFLRPQDNINFARGIGHEQHTMAAWLYVIGYLIVVPLVVYWPTALGLRWWRGREVHQARRDAQNRKSANYQRSSFPL